MCKQSLKHFKLVRSLKTLRPVLTAIQFRSPGPINAWGSQTLRIPFMQLEIFILNPYQCWFIRACVLII